MCDGHLPCAATATSGPQGDDEADWSSQEVAETAAGRSRGDTPVVTIEGKGRGRVDWTGESQAGGVDGPPLLATWHQLHVKDPAVPGCRSQWLGKGREGGKLP